jgi:hypothetical protein
MWWWCSIQLRRVLVGCTLLAASSLAVSVARAQDRDEETREEFDEIVAKIGIPAGGRERVVYVGRNLLFIQVPRELGGAPRASDTKLRADLLAMAKSELQIGMRAIVAQLQGPTSTDLDVLAETGNDVFSEPLMQRALIRRTSDREIIERARAGQLAMAAASVS